MKFSVVISLALAVGFLAKAATAAEITQLETSAAESAITAQQLSTRVSPQTSRISPQTSLPCHAKVGVLFENCIDPLWQRATLSQNTRYWEVLSVSDNNQVIAIDFSQSANTSFRIEADALSDSSTPHEWLDLTAFKHGELTFDLQIIDYGNNLNGFEVSLGCSSQCQSAPVGVYGGNVGEWQTIKIPVSQLIAEGLEISQVQTGFAIQPVIGEHKGVKIRLDNILFTAPIPEPMDLVAL